MLPTYDVEKAVPLSVGANAFLAQGKYNDAIRLYNKILEISELHDCSIWKNLGVALHHAGHTSSALICLKRARELNTNNPELIRILGHFLTLQNRREEALQAFVDALYLDPHNVETRAFYAYTLIEFDRCDDALIQYDILCKMAPNNAHLLWKRAETNLYLGRFKKAWKDFERRWQLNNDSTFLPQDQIKKISAIRRWAGEDLNGKTIVLSAEQGLGDIIFCSRYIPLVKARGANIIFKCPDELYRLFQCLPGVRKFIDENEKIDFHAPLMDLPGIFNTSIQSIPPPVQLHVPETLLESAKKLIDLALNKFKVGIVWAGKPTFKGNYKRSATFTRFLSLAEINNVQLYSLQKGESTQDIAACGAQGLVIELGPHLQDFADTAAVLQNLDLVIMTDSSVAHLAGSLGCPVWNLLSTGAYWIYLQSREDSPWYPSMRLFRQQRPGDWDSVFRSVSIELEKAVALKKAGKWPRLINSNLPLKQAA